MHQKMKGTSAKIDDELDKTSGPPLHRKYFNLGTICYKVLTIGGHYDYRDNNWADLCETANPVSKYFYKKSFINSALHEG